jgi:hypothetical protein
MLSASPDVKIYFGQGSPLTDITDMVLSDLPLGDKGIFVEATPFGATATMKRAVGMSDPPDLTMEMLFDDKVGGSMALFSTISGPNTADYHLHVHWTAGSPRSSSLWPCAIGEFTILGKVKDMTRARVVLISRGACVQLRQGA